jgi:hypothetical protein
MWKQNTYQAHGLGIVVSGLDIYELQGSFEGQGILIYFHKLFIILYSSLLEEI